MKKTAIKSKLIVRNEMFPNWKMKGTVFGKRKEHVFWNHNQQS